MLLNGLLMMPIANFVFTDGDNTYDVLKYEQHKKLMIENNLDMIVGKKV